MVGIGRYWSVLRGAGCEGRSGSVTILCKLVPGSPVMMMRRQLWTSGFKVLAVLGSNDWNLLLYWICCGG